MQLTENMIVARSKHSDLSAIKRINLWGCELTDISIVRNMTNIEVLALSVNNLSCLKPLENCKKLQELYLRKNNIEDFNQLTHLQNLPMLTHLWLAENPCCESAGVNYRAHVVKMLPNLKKLDEEIVTAEDIELAKKLDCHPTESARTEVIQKNSPESHTTPQTTAIEQSNASPKSNQDQDTNKQSPNCNSTPKSSPTLMNMNSKSAQLENSPPPNEGPNAIVVNSCLPELNSKQQSPYSDELQSPNKSVLSQHSSASDHRAEKTDGSFAVPLSFSPCSENEQSPPKEVQLLNQTHSINQIPQLNLVVQIHQAQSGLEIPLQIPRSISLQTINECTDHEEEQRDQQYQQYDAAGGQTARSNYRNLPEVGAENISRASTARLPQECLEIATQTPRSRYSMGSNNNSCWEDGVRTDRNSARSSSTLTTTSRSARRHNANVLAALLCIVPELDMESLQVLDHSIQCRMDELSLE